MVPEGTVKLSRFSSPGGSHFDMHALVICSLDLGSSVFPAICTFIEKIYISIQYFYNLQPKG